MASGRGVSLDPWQRQAVLAAAAFLRERFGTAGDARAKVVHDGLLEVVEPTRRAIRLQREMSTSIDDKDAAARGSGHERRRGPDRRVEQRGAPMGIERRRRGRRTSSARRATA